MDKKLEALANDIMEQCQKQGLTCREVRMVLRAIETRAAEQEGKAADRELFTAMSF